MQKESLEIQLKETEGKMEVVEEKYGNEIEKLNDELDELTETILNKKDLEIKFEAEKIALTNKLNILVYQNQELINKNQVYQSEL